MLEELNHVNEVIWKGPALHPAEGVGEGVLYVIRVLVGFGEGEPKTAGRAPARSKSVVI